MPISCWACRPSACSCCSKMCISPKSYPGQPGGAESAAAQGHTEDIAHCLVEHSDALAAFDSRLEGLEARQEHIAIELERCLKNVGIVRFNAFDDIGGEQSFAVALLDAQRNGILVSSLYGRQDSRLYAKGIVKGQGERPLSGEEQRAMEKALSVREV